MQAQFVSSMCLCACYGQIIHTLSWPQMTGSAQSTQAVASAHQQRAHLAVGDARATHFKQAQVRPLCAVVAPTAVHHNVAVGLLQRPLEGLHLADLVISARNESWSVNPHDDDVSSGCDISRVQQAAADRRVGMSAHGHAGPHAGVRHVDSL